MRHLIPLVFLLSCATETAQQRTSFPVTVTGTLPSAPNEAGWTVTLSSAHAAIGPVRFFSGKVLLSARPPTLPELLWRPFGGVAHAHPGHYQEGEALGEVAGTTIVDLLATAPVEVGTASAVTGEYGSLELTIATATDPQGHAIHLTGTATKDATTVTFELAADLLGPLAGVRAEQVVDLPSPAVNLDLNLATWLARVDFSKAGAPDDAGVTHVPIAAEAYNAFVRGASDTAACVVTWAP